MGEIRFPKNPVDPDVIAQLDACLLVPEVDIALLTENVARLALEAVVVKLVSLPFIVTRFKHVWDPSDTALRADEGQLREALEHAAQQEIGKDLRGERE